MSDNVFIESGSGNMIIKNKIIKKFKSGLSILAYIAGILTLLYIIIKPYPELSVTTITSEQLTITPDVPELRANYFYNNIRINNLWKIRIKIRNTGAKTIIGKGNNNTIIGDSIKLGFPRNFQILNVVRDSGNFKCDKGKIIENIFTLDFDQWRKDESVFFSLYIKDIKNNNDRPLLLSLNRPLIDGDIFIRNTPFSEINRKKPLIDYFPYTISKLIRIISGLLLATTVLVIIIIFIMMIIDYFKITKWLSKYKKRFYNIMDYLKVKEDKHHYLKGFHKIYKKLYKKYKIDEHIPEINFPFKTIKSQMKFIFGLLILLLVAVMMFLGIIIV